MTGVDNIFISFFLNNTQLTVCKNKGKNPNNWFGTVTLTGLNGNDIVGTLQCRIFKRPADATERVQGRTAFFFTRKTSKKSN
jgi:hypothetical protein